MTCSSIYAGPGLENPIELPTAEARASLENPATSFSNPAAWFVDSFGGGQSFAGETVSPHQALELSTMWRGVRLLAGDIAKLPLCTYRRTADARGKETDRQHAAHKLLRRRVAPSVSAVDFKEALAASAIWRGNGYARIYRTAGGRPVKLALLDPDSVFPAVLDGEVFYVLEATPGEPRQVLFADQVLHVKGLGCDGLMGYDLVTVGKQVLGAARASLRYSGEFFANAAVPLGVIEMPGTLNENQKQKLSGQMSSWHGSSGKRHTTPVFDRGMIYKQVSYNARDSQLIESRKFSTREVANLLGLPPHKLGDDSRTSYSSLEQSNQEYLGESLDPWLCKIEQECELKLLTDEERETDSHLIEFNRKALLRADLATRTAANMTRLQNGTLSPNEWRAMENENPIPGGDAYYIPLNFTTTGDDQGADEPPPPSDPPADPPAARNLLAAAVPVIASLQKEARRAASRPEKWHHWCTGMPARWQQRFAPLFTLAGRELRQLEEWLTETQLQLIAAGDGERSRFADRVTALANSFPATFANHI